MNKGLLVLKWPKPATVNSQRKKIIKREKSFWSGSRTQKMTISSCMQRRNSIVNINQKMTSRSLAPPMLLSTDCESPGEGCVCRPGKKRKKKLKSSRAPHTNSFSNMRSLWTSFWNGKTWGHLSVPWWMWTFRAVENRWGVAGCRVLKHPTSKLSETYTWLIEGKRGEASKWSQISDHIVHTMKNIYGVYFFIYNLKHAHSTLYESNGRYLTMNYEYQIWRACHAICDALYRQLKTTEQVFTWRCVWLRP